jgi:16S rRNA C1402 (ribose-2'-O) methylase RsmI
LDIQRAGITAVTYESPNRILRTLGFIEEIFGPRHEVYVGVELTKLHERHYRDTVQRVREQIELESEGTRFKGEITLVISPYLDSDNVENEKVLRTSGFDPKRDANVKVDLISVAKKLHESVDMSEHEFRLLLQKVFENVPTYHIKAIVRTVRKGDKMGRFE